MRISIAHIFRSCLSFLSPRLNTKVSYYVKFKRRLDLKHPKTFNEKLLWLKLYTFANNPLVKKCADKYRVRAFVSQKGLESLLNPIIAVYDNPEAIDWGTLPHAFAMKLNVGSGCNLVVRDKDIISIDNSKRIVKQWFRKNLWAGYSELQYKGVKRYVLIEKFIGDPSSKRLPTDYKFYCMNGVCRFILVCLDRGVETDRPHHAVKYFFMDRQWNLLPYTPEALEYKGVSIDRPSCLDDAISKAEVLASDFPFVRVDFYIVDNLIVFGELTFTPAGAMDTELMLIPPGGKTTVDDIFGETLTIPGFE